MAGTNAQRSTARPPTIHERFGAGLGFRLWGLGSAAIPVKLSAPTSIWAVPKNRVPILVLLNNECRNVIYNQSGQCFENNSYEKPRNAEDILEQPKTAI